MKIIHVAEPMAGGILTFLQSLVGNLQDDAHIVIHGERKEEMRAEMAKKKIDYPNVKFIRWRSAQRGLNIFKDINAFTELYVILKRLKKSRAFDIVHLHSSKGGFLGRMVCRVLKIQDAVVYTPNGAPFMAGKSKLSNFLYKVLEKIGAGLGGQIVCCSASERAVYLQAGISAVTINNGTQFRKTTYNPSAKKNNLFRIVTSGRIVKQKNPAMFNTIATYFEEFKQFEFVWIGDGPDRNLLSAKNIKITGWLNANEVNDMLAGATLYLSTSLFEGLPFAVLEALALEKPVLLSDCTGNKDLVNKGLNGDVFENGNGAINKLLEYYNNTSMLSVMGKNSHSHGTVYYNLFNTYQAYKNLYQNILTRKRKRYNTSPNQFVHGTN